MPFLFVMQLPETDCVYCLEVFMRKFSRSLAMLAMVAVLGYIFVFMESEIPGPPGWPSDIKLYRKPALGGLTRVYDTKTNDFLFWYLPEYDPNVHPIKIERIGDRHWQVTFKAPQ